MNSSSDKIFDALIFDLDGTLWDSTAPVARAFNNAMHQTLVRPRTEISTSDIENIMGMPHKKIFETLFPETGEEEREKLAVNCYEEEIAVIRKMGAAMYPGVREGLAKLAKQFPLFLVSNCQVPYLETFFEWTGMRHLFVDWECHGGTGLPKADNIQSILKRHQLTKSAYVGDTSGDQEAAEWAGATYLHLTYGFGNPIRPCRTFDRFDELVNFLLP